MTFVDCAWTRPVDSLFRRFAVEVFVVGFRVGAGMVDDAVPMIRRRIERIELQWNTAAIDDVVRRPGRDDDREARSNRRPNAIENRLTGPLLHAKKLVELVDFRPDLFLGLQRHHDELAVLGRVKHPAKLVILDGETLDVLHKAFHSDSSFVSVQAGWQAAPARPLFVIAAPGNRRVLPVPRSLGEVAWRFAVSLESDKRLRMRNLQVACPRRSAGAPRLTASAGRTGPSARSLNGWAKMDRHSPAIAAC